MSAHGMGGIKCPPATCMDTKADSQTLRSAAGVSYLNIGVKKTHLGDWNASGYLPQGQQGYNAGYGSEFFN